MTRGGKTVLAMLVAVTVLPPDGPAAAECTWYPVETVKFVQDVQHQAAATGVMGSMFSYERLGTGCWGDVAFSTVFLRISDDYLDFAEVGLRYDDDFSKDVRPHLFLEYGVGPDPENLTRQDFSTVGLNGWHSFNLSPVGNGSWKMQYVPGLSLANWVTYGYTPVYAAGFATPEAESAKYTGANGYTWHKQLRYRPATGGGWYGWVHLGCDYDARTMLDYRAVKASNTEWSNQAGAPGAGQC